MGGGAGDASLHTAAGREYPPQELLCLPRGPQPAQTGGYDWVKLEQEFPLSSIMFTIKAAWEWMGYVDQGLVLVFVPLLIVLLVKVKRLENASTNRQGAVNVAVAAPTMVPPPTTNTSARHSTDCRDP